MDCTRFFFSFHTKPIRLIQQHENERNKKKPKSAPIVWMMNKWLWLIARVTRDQQHRSIHESISIVWFKLYDDHLDVLKVLEVERSARVTCVNWVSKKKTAKNVHTGNANISVKRRHIRIYGLGMCWNIAPSAISGRLRGISDTIQEWRRFFTRLKIKVRFNEYTYTYLHFHYVLRSASAGLSSITRD